MPNPQTDHSVRYIDDPRDLDDVAVAMEASSHFAIDTESNSLHVYQEQVCYVQICVGDEVFIIDTVAIRDLSPLRPALEDERIIKLLHGADYDVVCLKRDFDIALFPIFDTMICGQIFEYPKLGLAALVQEHCGAELDKTMTRHDWGARPLDERYLPYLVEDVIYLDHLYGLFMDRLEDEDLVEEAEIEFDRVSDQEWKGRTGPDPEGFRRIKGSQDLDHAGLSVLRQLYFMREAIAEAANQPTFRIVGNAQLLAASDQRPRNLAGLSRIRGFSDRVLRRLGRQTLEAIKEGLATKEDVPLRLPRPKRPPEIQTEIEDSLRSWRKEIMAQEKRPSIVVLPNHVVDRLKIKRPRTPEELKEIKGLGKNRFRLYGEDLLELICSFPEEDSSARRKSSRPSRSKRAR